MSKEAMKLALEALEGVLDDSPKVLEASISGGLYEVVQCREAIAAIKKALAQPEQEPVAWLFQDRTWTNIKAMADDHPPTVPVYTTPPQRTWVGLTDAEADELWESTDSDDDWELMKRTEAKLRSKNENRMG